MKNVILRLLVVAALALGPTAATVGCADAYDTPQGFSQEQYDAGIAGAMQKLEEAVSEYMPMHHPELAEQLGVDNPDNYAIALSEEAPKAYKEHSEWQPNHEGYGIYSVDFVHSDCTVQIEYAQSEIESMGNHYITPYWGAIIDTPNGRELRGETKLEGTEAYMTPDFWRHVSNFCLLPRVSTTA